MVGMLVVVGRGSIGQLFVAVCISFVCFSLQIHLTPYKHFEDNLLKASVEAHLVLTVTIALALKCLEYQSSSSAATASTASIYDFVLVLSFVICVPTVFIWSVWKKHAMLANALLSQHLASTQDVAAEDGHGGSTAARQRAIHLLQLGLTSADDLKILSAYFHTLDNLVNKSTHVFISYRVASDRELARRLFDELSNMTLVDTGQKVRVYLDQTKLEDGQRWDSGFMLGLSKSMVFVPLVSVGSVAPMVRLTDSDDWIDNVLLEWTAALELHQRGRIKAVLPILIGEEDFFTESQSFGGVGALATTPSAKTMQQVVTHLHEHTGDSSTDGLQELLQQATGQPAPAVQGVVTALLKFQGIKLQTATTSHSPAHGHGQSSLPGASDLNDCTRRIHDAVSACIKRVGVYDTTFAELEHAHSTGSKQSALSKLSSRLARRPSSAGSGSSSPQVDDIGLEHSPVRLGGGLLLSTD